MTLARGSIGVYDHNRMVLLFSMMDGASEIPCAVSASAMDDVEHVARTAPDQRKQQFLRLRDRVERCASRKFLAQSSRAILPASFYAALIFAICFGKGSIRKVRRGPVRLTDPRPARSACGPEPSKRDASV